LLHCSILLYIPGMPARRSHDRPAQADLRSGFDPDGAEAALSRSWLCSRCRARETTHEPSPRPVRCLSCFGLEGQDSEFTPLDDEC
jgi:hypothetical protein